MYFLPHCWLTIFLISQLFCANTKGDYPFCWRKFHLSKKRIIFIIIRSHYKMTTSIGQSLLSFHLSLTSMISFFFSSSCTFWIDVNCEMIWLFNLISSHSCFHHCPNESAKFDWIENSFKNHFKMFVYRYTKLISFLELDRYKFGWTIGKIHSNGHVECVSYLSLSFFITNLSSISLKTKKKNKSSKITIKWKNIEQ